MATNVFLDAMVPRANFAAIDEDKNLAGSLVASLSIETLKKEGFLVPNLRKPDFQRETNHWVPEQISTFVKSFLDGDLIPSIILWKSNSHIFVIDGAHRLSALRAWIEDDYGDGDLSRKFYNNKIPKQQLEIAEKTRKLVTKNVGSFKLLQAINQNPDTHPADFIVRAKNMATNTLIVQWVQGNAEKAETSFFKINKKGTPLDKVEEKIIKYRKRPAAIAARCIVRAGSGHKYWSAFDANTQTEIEILSQELFTTLFHPEIDTPIKTLDLPLGGTSSTVDALDIIMDLIEYCNTKEVLENTDDDKDGFATVAAMQSAKKIIERITSNSAGSVGLHPAVYFYNHKGSHSKFMFLAIVSLFSEKIQNNDSNFFVKFSKGRAASERFLLANKAIVSQIISITGSKNRVETLKKMFITIFDLSLIHSEIPLKEVMDAIGFSGSAILEKSQDNQGTFSKETKNEIFLKQSLQNAMACTICSGLMDVSKSSHYDHKVPKYFGGSSSADNGQMIHPYCNTALKNQQDMAQKAKE